MMKLWEMLSGYKTYIGIIVWGMANLLMAVKPEWMAALQTVETLAMTVTGVGVGHKLAKME